MSDKNLARRTKAEIAFAGVNITNTIQPYLLSVTYTDCEEDEADDLQIKLQDRNGDWLIWLGEAIDAAASESTSDEASEGGGTYTVTAKSGLNVRTGPGTNHSRLGALAYGTSVSVSGTENGWAIINYNGSTAYVYAGYLSEGGDAPAASGSSSKTALKIQAVFVCENWLGDGNDRVLDCGQFELDDVASDGPPDVVTIKATALPNSTGIRKTKKSRVWEAYSLSGIANEIARAGGMSCIYESSYDPKYERIEQLGTSDIEFLSDLCHNAGISLKTTNNILVLFDQAEYEAKPEIITIKRGDGSYIKHHVGAGAAVTQYTSCRVSYTDPDTGKCIEATVKIEDYDEGSEENRQLEINAKVSSIAEAEVLAKKKLRLYNKYEKTVSFTFPGNPNLVSGITGILEGWGCWDGKYIISRAAHTLSGGYTTKIEMRRCLEGY